MGQWQARAYPALPFPRAGAGLRIVIQDLAVQAQQAFPYVDSPGHWAWARNRLQAWQVVHSALRLSPAKRGWQRQPRARAQTRRTTLREHRPDDEDQPRPRTASCGSTPSRNVCEQLDSPAARPAPSVEGNAEQRCKNEILDPPEPVGAGLKLNWKRFRPSAPAILCSISVSEPYGHNQPQNRHPQINTA